MKSCSIPRWDNLPSEHQRYPLFGLNLGYMYWGPLGKLSHLGLEQLRYRVIRIKYNNKKFPSPTFYKLKHPPCGGIGIIRHYRYRVNKKLCQVIFYVQRITCSCRPFQIQISIPYDSKIKYPP